MIERDLFTGKLLVDKTEKLNFGKYQGRTLSTVMITDPQYLHILNLRKDLLHI